MRTHALIFFLWLLAAPQLFAWQAADVPQLHFRPLGASLPDGTRIGVVQRRAGLETKFEVVTLTKGAFNVDVPLKDGKGDTVTWFLIVAMTEAMQFDAFLDHPGKWTWVSFVTQVGQGHQRGMLIEKTSRPLDFFGRVVGPGGVPLERLSVRFWGQSGRTLPGKERRDIMRIGYDPCSGRFWAQRVLAQRPKLTNYRLDFLPHGEHEVPNPLLATLFRVPCSQGKRLRIRIPAAASIRGKILGWKSDGLIHYQLKLAFENGIDAGPPVFEQQAFVFQGLPEGRYRLRIQLASDLQSLHTSKVLALGEGQALKVDDLDLRELVTPIQVRVRDANGFPIRAWVHHVHTLRDTAPHMPGMSGKGTGESGAMSLLIPKTGVPLVIRAEGLGAVVLPNVTKDLDVVLKKPVRVILRVQGSEKDSKLLNSLFLLAEPVEGYPDWAWRALAGRFGWEEARRPKGEPPVAMASARLDSYGTRSMDLPSAGKWKFELAYCRRFTWVRIPFPAMGIHQLDTNQELDVPLPLEALRKARARFDATAKPR